MAASGRMSTYHDRHPGAGGGSSFTSPVSGRTPPSQYQWPTMEEQEMARINYIHTGKPVQGHSPGVPKHSPGLAQGRWPHASRDDEDEEVPLSAVPRDDVGPGQGQVKDPFLHEQFFGVASSGVEGEVVPDAHYHASPSVDHQGWMRS